MEKSFKKFEKSIKKVRKIAEERDRLNEEISTLALMAIESKNAKNIYLVGHEFNENLDQETIDKMAKAILKVGKQEDWEAFANDVMHISVVDLIIDYAEIKTNEEAELE